MLTQYAETNLKLKAAHNNIVLQKGTGENLTLLEIYCATKTIQTGNRAKELSLTSSLSPLPPPRRILSTCCSPARSPP